MQCQIDDERHTREKRKHHTTTTTWGSHRIIVDLSSRRTCRENYTTLSRQLRQKCTHYVYKNPPLWCTYVKYNYRTREMVFFLFAIGTLFFLHIRPSNPQFFRESLYRIINSQRIFLNAIVLRVWFYCNYIL